MLCRCRLSFVLPGSNTNMFPQNSLSVHDLADKVNETIQKAQRHGNVNKLHPSYGKMWCPGPPQERSPLDIGVEWMIGCNSEEDMSITSLPELPVLEECKS